MRLLVLTGIGVLLALVLVLNTNAQSSQKRMDVMVEETGDPKNSEQYPVSIMQKENSDVEFVVYACGKLLTFTVLESLVTTKEFEDFILEQIAAACGG